MFTLLNVVKEPHVLTTSVVTTGGERLVLRSLKASDVCEIAQFLKGLSPETRYFSTFGDYDLAGAQELCDAIARYDKLRFVIEQADSKKVVGLLEFSFAITEADRARYTGYNILLDPTTDCRFGRTLADDYQNKGVGTLALPFIAHVARKFGKKRIILWGGVVTDNFRALRFYEKNDFKAVGKFTNQDNLESMDMLLDL